MRIAITGASGLIGSALIPVLEAQQHSVTRLVRPGSHSTGVQWDPHKQEIDLAGLEGHDAVIHLAGESIAGLWTSAKRRRIRDSRIEGTRLIATSVARLTRPPNVLISVSAIGFYGNRPAEDPTTETAGKGAGFLADVSAEWEAAAAPARAAGIRVVHPRLGLVLSQEGGSLAAMLPVFRLGLGGHLGSGRQVWSWVAIDDVAGAILKCIGDARLAGPVNVVAPQPVTNLAFTRTLGRVLRRPTLLGVPGFVLTGVGGEAARELVLFGARVVPRKLQEAGYEFKYPELEAALRHVLRRN